MSFELFLHSLVAAVFLLIWVAAWIVLTSQPNVGDDAHQQEVSFEPAQPHFLNSTAQKKDRKGKNLAAID